MRQFLAEPGPPGVYIRSAMASTRQEQPEQLTDEDRRYGGSRFSDVVDALFANPYQRVWGGEGQPPLPVGKVTFRSVFGGILPLAAADLFRKASERTLDSGADLRWGADRKGFRRLVHPNGVCLIGQWRIVEETAIFGLFQQGEHGARRSPGTRRAAPRRGADARGRSRWSASSSRRPTPSHALPLRTANFITQEDIGGADTEFINDAELRNAPDTTASRRGAGAALLAVVGLMFNRVDTAADHPSAVSDRRARQTGGNADAGAGVHAAARRLTPTENRRRRSRLPRRNHGADIRPWRSGAEAHAHVHDRSDRSGTDHGAGAEAAAHVSGLARDRVADLRQCRHLLQRGFGHPLQPPDLARGPQRPGDRDANRRPQSALIDKAVLFRVTFVFSRLRGCVHLVR